MAGLQILYGIIKIVYVLVKEVSEIMAFHCFQSLLCSIELPYDYHRTQSVVLPDFRRKSNRVADAFSEMIILHWFQSLLRWLEFHMISIDRETLCFPIFWEQIKSCRGGVL